MSTEATSGIDWSGLNWTALAAVTVFLASQLFGIISGIAGRRRTKQNLAKALLAEILAENETILRSESLPFDPELMISVAKLSLEALPSHVFEENVGNIGIFPKDMVSDIVSMYSKSYSMANIYRAIRSEGFSESPPDIQETLLNVLKDVRSEHASLAKSLVSRLEKYTK